MNTSLLEANCLLVRTKDVVETSLNGHLLMMGIEQGQYYDLNPTASLLWQALSQPQRVDQLYALVLDRYAVSESDGQAAVQDFLRQLLAERLICIVTEA